MKRPEGVIGYRIVNEKGKVIETFRRKFTAMNFVRERKGKFFDEKLTIENIEEDNNENSTN